MSFGNKGDITLYLDASNEYLYDVHDQLIRTETYAEDQSPRVLTETRKYIHERGHCVVEFNDGDAAYRLYGQGVDVPLAVDKSDSYASETIVWTLTDNQGTVRDLAVVEVGGLLQEHIEYTPFGVPTAASNTYGITTFYAGRDFDEFTGLYNNRARWYDSAAGRFISEDPINADINPYRYALNSPANFTDPSGEFAVCTTIGILCLAGLAWSSMAGNAHTPELGMSTDDLVAMDAARQDAAAAEVGMAVGMYASGGTFGALRTAGAGLGNLAWAGAASGLTFAATSDVIIGAGTGDLAHYRDALPQAPTRRPEGKRALRQRLQ